MRGPVAGSGEDVGDGGLVRQGAGRLRLIRRLPLADRLALTAPQVGGASGVMLHLTGSDCWGDEVSAVEKGSGVKG